MIDADVNFDSMDGDEDWAEWVPIIEEAILAGRLDDHLRKLARCIFTRRGTLEGSPTKYVQPEQVAPPKKDAAASKLSDVSAKSQARRARNPRAPSVRPYVHGVLGPDTLSPGQRPLRNVLQGKADPETEFEYAGLVWAKKQFVGYTFTPKPGSFAQGSYDGMQLYISGVGPKMLMVEVVYMPPRVTHGKWYGSYKTGKPLYMAKDILHNWCDFSMKMHS